MHGMLKTDGEILGVDGTIILKLISEKYFIKL
jgi:hypothetical protein